MKLWNGSQWLEYSGEPVTAAVLAASSPPMALDPSIHVLVEDAAVPLVEMAHAQYRSDLIIECSECEDTAELTPVTSSSEGKRPGALPTPIATFHFDTSTED